MPRISNRVKPYLFLASSAFLLSFYQGNVVYAEADASSASISSPAEMDATIAQPSATSQPTSITVTLGTEPNSEASLASTSSVSTGDETPEITDVQVTGNVDTNLSGVDAFSGVEVKLQGKNLTKDHFLTKEGLRWTDKTQVEIIKGYETGQLNDAQYWGKNNPQSPVTAYSMNAGDQGRITHVGTTQSGIDLDLIYTVVATDQDDWNAHSRLRNDGRVRGVAFTGEQAISGQGDAIAVFYNGANILQMTYQIVKHGTEQAMPVILSFITTDIDAAQGVVTNIDNLARVIPTQTNLAVNGNLIYDASTGSNNGYGANYNGAEDLPYGGYLGAGFVSSFRYDYYAPAPTRAETYPYAFGVRYDLFGSALQAHMTTQVRQYLTVNYLDESGKVIRPAQYYLGLSNASYQLPIEQVDKYTFSRHTLDQSKSNKPIVNLYFKRLVGVTYRFLDELGRPLQDAVTTTVKEGDSFSYSPGSKAGYITPADYKGQADKQDVVHDFVYQTLYQLVINYKDQDGKVLRPADTYTHLRGQAFDYQAPALAGYARSQGHYQGVVSGHGQHDFIYTRQYQVDLRLQDAQTQEELARRQVLVKQDETVHYTLPDLPGYHHDKAEITLRANQDRQEPVNYYKLYQLILRYQDQDGKTLAPDQVAMYPAQSQVSQSAPNLGGYLTPAMYQTTILQDVEHTFVYQKLYRVVTEYLDVQGKSLRPTQVTYLTKGQLYTALTPSIAGYVTPTNQEHEVTGDLKVSLVYRALPRTDLYQVPRFPTQTPSSQGVRGGYVYANPITSQNINQAITQWRQNPASYRPSPIRVGTSKDRVIVYPNLYGDSHSKWHQQKAKPLTLRNPREDAQKLYSKYGVPVQKFVSEELMPSLLFTLNDRVEKGNFLGSWLHNYNVMKNVQKNYNYDFKTIYELDYHLAYVEKQAIKQKRNPEYYVPLSLAYPVYKNSFAQVNYNDYTPFRERWGLFGDSTPLIPLSKDFEELALKLHNSKEYTNDLPHTLVAYASSKTHLLTEAQRLTSRIPIGTGEAVEIIKHLYPNYKRGEDIRYREDLKNNKLMNVLLNSISGDMMQLLDSKDWVSDLDAVYLAMSNSYSDMRFRKRLFEMLGQPDWNKKRDRAVIDLFPGETYEEREKYFFMIVLAAMNTLGGLVIAKKIRQAGQKEQTISFLEQKRTELIVNRMKEIAGNVVNKTKRVIVPILNNIVPKPVRRVWDSFVKNTRQVFNKFTNKQHSGKSHRGINHYLKRHIGKLWRKK